MIQSLPRRSEVPVEFTWDAHSIFPDNESWEAEFAAVKSLMPGLDRFCGRLSQGPDILIDWLGAIDDFNMRLGKLHVYAHMFHTVDTADQEASARYTRASALWSQFRAASAFGEPEILAIDPERLKRWIEAEPKLSSYAHYFDKLLSRRTHVRSAEVEEVLGLVSEPFSSARRIHSTLSDADLTFRPARGSDGEEHEIAQGTIGKVLSSPDRELRRSAWEHYADAYLANKDTMAGCLAAGVKQNVFNVRTRRYASSLEAALSDEHVPTEVFHNLITTYRANLPTWHRYWDIRRRALGLDRLRVYDFKAPLTSNSPIVPYEQAIEWICDGMRPLGSHYVETMRRGLDTQRWVDVYPNKGKRMGAFSSGSQGTHPFILMSYNNDLSGMSTLAHELGHSMHSFLAWENQPPVYSEYGLFVAEVASNFNQAMVRAYLLANMEDPDFQIALIEEAMSHFHRYFFVMPALARFELEIHERAERGEALTASGLGELMSGLFLEGFGGKVDVDEERVGITWAQFPTHLYSNFYVYQYATGIAGAHSLANRVLDGGPEAAEDYLAFLKAGGSLYPLDALRLAGVDLSVPQPVHETFQLLATYVDRLEALVA